MKIWSEIKEEEELLLNFHRKNVLSLNSIHITVGHRNYIL